MLLICICGALLLAIFVSQVSANDYRSLLHGVTPPIGAAILAGLAYTIMVKTWDRWVTLPFTLGAMISFLMFFLRVGW